MASVAGSVSLPVRVLATATAKLGAFSAVLLAETVSVSVAGSGLSLIAAGNTALSMSGSSSGTLTLTPVSPTTLSL